MKRLLKLGVAAFTALSMVGTPMTTFAESNDPEKEELTEHYWYDNGKRMMPVVMRSKWN